MSYELDHLFVWTRPGGEPAATALAAAGFTEGSGNIHLGQGTANRRFFFDNFMLELLWVAAEVPADGPQLARTTLPDRWQGGRQVCPFGVALRPQDHRASPPPPFDGWRYEPPYLPEPHWLHLAETPLAEPLLIYLPFGERQSRRVPVAQREHGNGLRSLRSLSLRGPWPGARSAALRDWHGCGWLQLERADAYSAELTFAARRAVRLDLQPRLPLLFVGASDRADNRIEFA